MKASPWGGGGTGEPHVVACNGHVNGQTGCLSATLEPFRPPNPSQDPFGRAARSPSVTQAGGTQTNPTPSGGGGYTKWEGHEQPLPLGGGGGTHSGRDVYLKGNAI